MKLLNTLLLLVVGISLAKAETSLDPLTFQTFKVIPGVTLTAPVPKGLTPSAEEQPVYLNQYMVFRVADLRQPKPPQMRRYTVYMLSPEREYRFKNWLSTVEYIKDSYPTLQSRIEQDLADELKKSTKDAPFTGAVLEAFEYAPVPYSVFNHSHKAGIESLCVQTMLPVGRQVVFFNYCEGSEQFKPRSTKVIKESEEFRRFLLRLGQIADPGLWSYRDSKSPQSDSPK